MLDFSANDSVSQFEISHNKQEFVGSPYLSAKSVGEEKLVKYSALNSLYGSDPNVNMGVWEFNNSSLIMTFCFFVP